MMKKDRSETTLVVGGPLAPNPGPLSGKRQNSYDSALNLKKDQVFGAADDSDASLNEWWLLFDSNTKRFYYYNPSENRTAWHLPAQTRSPNGDCEYIEDESSSGQQVANCAPVIPLACKLVTILNSLKTANVNIDYYKILDTSLLNEIKENLKLDQKPGSKTAPRSKYPSYLNFLLRNQVYGQYVLDLVGDIMFSNSLKSLQTAAKLTDCFQTAIFDDQGRPPAPAALDRSTGATDSSTSDSTLTLNRKRRLQPRTNPNYINVDLINRNDGSLIKNTYVKLQDLPATGAGTATLEKKGPSSSSSSSTLTKDSSSKNTLNKNSSSASLSGGAKTTDAAAKQASPNSNVNTLSHSNSSSKLNNSLSKAALLLLNILSDKNCNGVVNHAGNSAPDDGLKVSASTTSVNTLCNRLSQAPGGQSTGGENSNLNKENILLSSSVTLVGENGGAANRNHHSLSKKSGSINVKPPKLKNFSSLSTSLTRRNTESNVKYITKTTTTLDFSRNDTSAEDEKSDMFELNDDEDEVGCDSTSSNLVDSSLKSPPTSFEAAKTTANYSLIATSSPKNLLNQMQSAVKASSSNAQTGAAELSSSFINSSSPSLNPNRNLSHQNRTGTGAVPHLNASHILNLNHHHHHHQHHLHHHHGSLSSASLADLNHADLGHDKTGGAAHGANNERLQAIKRSFNKKNSFKKLHLNLSSNSKLDYSIDDAGAANGSGMATTGGSNAPSYSSFTSQMLAFDSLSQCNANMLIKNNLIDLNNHSTGSSRFKNGFFFFSAKKKPQQELMVWSNQSIQKPLMKTNDKIVKKEASDLFKLIQIYMGDRKASGGGSSSSSFGHGTLSTSTTSRGGELSSSFVQAGTGEAADSATTAGANTSDPSAQDMVCLDIMTKGWIYSQLRDELYLQLVKQTTANYEAGSLLNGWRLIAISLSFFPPSQKLFPFLSQYIHSHLNKAQTTTTTAADSTASTPTSPSVAGASGQEHGVYVNSQINDIARACLKRLERIHVSGAKKGLKKPTIEEIVLSRNTIVSPSLFGTTLDEIMNVQKVKCPDLKLPWIQTTLSEAVLRLNGAKTEGIFRVPGDLDEVNNLKVKFDQFWFSKENLLNMADVEKSFAEIMKNVQDPHLPASLLKLWYRELYEPLIPSEYYDECIRNCDKPQECVRIIECLPEINKLVFTYLIRFLKVFAASENVAITKMDASNLSMIMAPNCLRCKSDEPKVIMENTKKEMQFIKTLIQHLDTSIVQGIV